MLMDLSTTIAMSTPGLQAPTAGGNISAQLYHLRIGEIVFLTIAMLKALTALNSETLGIVNLKTV